MNKWLDTVLGNGGMLMDYYMGMSLDDSFGWGRLLDQMWFSDPDARPTGTGVLLTGPSGSGRHTAAAYLIRQLVDRGYTLAVLHTGDLTPENGGFPELRERLNALLDHCLEEGQALCLLTENLSISPFGWDCAAYLGDMLCYYFLRRKPDFAAGGPRDRTYQGDLVSQEEQFEPLFLICIEDEIKNLPSVFRSRLQVCSMTLPDEEQRLSFLRSHEPRFNHHRPGHISGADFVEWTEGLSYADLEDLVQNLNAAADQDGDIQRVLESQLSRRTSTKESLFARLEDLLKRLPEYLENLPSLLQRWPEEAAHNITIQHVDTVQSTQQDNVPKRKTRADYEKEPGSLLYANLDEGYRKKIEASIKKSIEPER